jgi:S1-C subfamily serine protease
MRSPSSSEERSTAKLGLVVLESLPGSVAKAAGLERGDVIISVNGVPTPDLESFIRARRLSCDRARLLIKRGEGSFVVEVALPPLQQPRPRRQNQPAPSCLN